MTLKIKAFEQIATVAAQTASVDLAAALAGGGTLLLEGSVTFDPQAGDVTLLSLGDGTGANAIAFAATADNRLTASVTVEGAQVGLLDMGPLFSGGSFRIALAWDAAGLAAARSGASLATPPDLMPPAGLTDLTFGHDGAALSTTRLAIWPLRLDAADLLTLTGGAPQLTLVSQGGEALLLRLGSDLVIGEGDTPYPHIVLMADL
ncbi:hypothetical protein SAMN05443999_101262 [Roseovarius azorensis]|uniref:Uncharacterized protein n=1 Tax=Roseovarius azorensis TaxID=1287727 RepID=A0A1H7G9J6_9RHOB|nr:hypothetical protein [Roseovarius azorensis]SEK34953.1 hypothetical protein SAMN05443999_101262 [Roseovarius azorensis]